MNEGISVIVPVFNGAEFVPDALASVAAQTHVPTQIIVIDDGSSDGSADIARACAPQDALIVSQPNAGPGAARNTGLDLAKFDTIAFLDVDDLWPRDKLARQLSYFRSQPDLSLVLGMVQHTVAPGASHFDMEFEDKEKNTLPFFHFGAGLFRKSAFDTVGPISAELADSEDHDWFIRFKEAGLNWIVEPEIGLIYRRHFSNMTQPGPLQHTELFRVLAQSVKRRRGANGAKALAKLTDRRVRTAQRDDP